MTEDELRRVVKDCGYTFRKRKKGNRYYFYAAHRLGKKVHDVYLFAESVIDSKNHMDVLHKLAL